MSFVFLNIVVRRQNQWFSQSWAGKLRLPISKVASFWDNEKKSEKDTCGKVMQGDSHL
jgi:hypothetical protein